MTMVLITGGIDISIGSVIAATCMMLAAMMEKGNIGAIPAMCNSFIIWTNIRSSSRLADCHTP